MKFSYFLKTFFVFLIFGIIFSFAFANSFFRYSINNFEVIAPKVYLGTEKLNSAIITFSTYNKILPENIVFEDCKVLVSKKGEHKNKYFFEIFFDKTCENTNFFIKKDSGIIYKGKLNIWFEKKGETFEKIVDLNDKEFLKYKEKLERKKNSINFLFKGEKNMDLQEQILNERIYKILKFQENLYNSIIENRQKKYISPIVGKGLPEDNFNKVPNAGRPYRKAYTDGIHHGWDIDTDFGEKVVALDDSVVIRIVDEFSDKDFDKLQKKAPITEDDEFLNLDILRGKQIWLKTSKGEVTFYSHMDDIPDDLEIGDFVKRGQFVGTVGISGVPQKDYKDYHLHFPIHENIDHKFASDTYLDYMKWPWKTQGMKTLGEVVAEQKKIFDY